jgi:hypothetical protein
MFAAAGAFCARIESFLFKKNACHFILQLCEVMSASTVWHPLYAQSWFLLNQIPVVYCFCVVEVRCWLLKHSPPWTPLPVQCVPGAQCRCACVSTLLGAGNRHCSRPSLYATASTFIHADQAGKPVVDEVYRLHTRRAVFERTMASHKYKRLSLLTIANILLPIAVSLFASGFFPYKPVLPGLAVFDGVVEAESTTNTQPKQMFGRMVLMVVDALRSDFVYSHHSGFHFTQRYAALANARSDKAK